MEASSGYFSSSPDSVLSFVRAAVRLQGLPVDKRPEGVVVTGDPKPAPKKLTPVQVRLVDDKPRQVAAGTELTVEVELEIASGYHTYGNPSTTDSAKPTELTMDEVASKPLTLTKVDYPPGELKQLPSSGLEPVSIYEGKPRLKATLMVPKDASGKELVATLVVAYQVCTDQFCLPPAKIRIPLKVIVK